jgi:HAD superfamily hydrolase (TIGR01509 family)
MVEKMTQPQAVLFDCDGVIVDSEGPTFALFLHDLARYGLPMSMETFEANFVGGTVEMVATRARAAGARLPEGWVGDFYDRMYAMLAAGVPLVAGVVDVLDRLDRAGVPFAMGSNGSLEKMEITLGQHGLAHRFRAVLSGQAIGSPKPAPDVYLMAAQACGARPEACIVIEDSANGAQAALAAGIPCLGYAEHGPDTPTARALAALGVPLFHRMADLPGLLGIGAL